MVGYVYPRRGINRAILHRVESEDDEVWRRDCDRELCGVQPGKRGGRWILVPEMKKVPIHLTACRACFWPHLDELVKLYRRIPLQPFPDDDEVTP